VASLSLVVATRNRRASLELLLGSLACLEAPEAFEAIMVDNGSTDGTADMLGRARVPFALVAVREPVAGKSRALNRGLGHASGDLIVFTDDDVLPRCDWLVRLAQAAHRHPGANVFGGRVEADGPGVPAWIRQSFNLQEMLLSQHDLGDRERAYPPGRYPIGPNMAVRRSAWQLSGAAWPLDMGPGTRLPLGDERGFLAQISGCAAGDRIYVPDAIVRHSPDPDRLRFRRTLRRCFEGGVAAGRLERRFPGPALARTAALGLAAHRIKTWRSVREAACALARAVGVLVGRRNDGAAQP
jgi:glucosyl-dolichyl phosphate glucuronosyltransferase